MQGPSLGLDGISLLLTPIVSYKVDSFCPRSPYRTGFTKETLLFMHGLIVILPSSIANGLASVQGKRGYEGTAIFRTIRGICRYDEIAIAKNISNLSRPYHAWANNRNKEIFKAFLKMAVMPKGFTQCSSLYELLEEVLNYLRDKPKL